MQSFKTGLAITAAAALIGVPSALSGRVPLDLKNTVRSSTLSRPPIPGKIINLVPIWSESYVTRAGCNTSWSFGTNITAGSLMGVVDENLSWGTVSYGQVVVTGDEVTPTNFMLKVPFGLHSVYVRYPDNESGLRSAYYMFICSTSGIIK